MLQELQFSLTLKCLSPLTVFSHTRMHTHLPQFKELDPVPMVEESES
jgi:hypothetical protein